LRARGRQDLELRLARGKELLDIPSKIIEIDTTDFAKIDGDGIVEWVKEAILG